MKIMIQSTKVRLPKAPTVRPMIDISKLSVGHDFASLKTLNCGIISVGGELCYAKKIVNQWMFCCFHWMMAAKKLDFFFRFMIDHYALSIVNIKL